MHTRTSTTFALKAAALLSATLTVGCAVFTPPSAETSRALEAYARWQAPGARPAATMQDLIDLGMVHRPEPCEPLNPTCAITPGSVAQAPGTESTGAIAAKPRVTYPIQTARGDRRILAQ